MRALKIEGAWWLPYRTAIAARTSSASTMWPMESRSISTVRLISATSASPPTSSIALRRPTIWPSDTRLIGCIPERDLGEPSWSGIIDSSLSPLYDEGVDVVHPAVELRLPAVPRPRQVDLQ